MSDELLINLTDTELEARKVEATDNIVEAEKQIELAKALKKLKGMDEFRLLFTEGYFDKYAQKIFKEMTNPPQFAQIPLENCEDTLAGIKALKSYLGFESNNGTVEQEGQAAVIKLADAEKVLSAIG